ncbi:MAG: hypothetical protein JW726_17045, partial [Anaerolineales bacterium]|nr:hypothetical protein [Anaerolineales bacterium]
MLDSDQSPYAIFFAADANPQAVVIAGKARFTLLTDRLLRMEYSNSAKFEDRPSQAFWFRRQPAPRYTLRCDGKEVQGEEGAGDGVTIIGGQVKVIELETEYILLRYRITGGHFTTNTLSVLVKATGATWRYGDLNWKGGNLYGTTRTLDGAQGFLQPEPGLMGRAGWAVVDDSHSLVFNPSGWIEPRQHPENDDLYLFGYGHDYPGCLADFYRVSGPVPLV